MNRDRALELKVGIFVAIGLAMIGGFVLKFGRLGEGFKIYYDLTVRFKDASGLLKGSDILLSGAKIGRVAGGPRLLREGEGVAVPIRIYEYVKIPKGSQFTVGSSGLLGDRFVNVITPPGPAKEYLPKNAVVDGARPTGIDDLTHAGSQLIEDLRGTVQNINGTFTRLNTEALLPEATNGNGLLASLIKDSDMGRDLRALVANLRAHGVLFFRDSAPKVGPSPSPTKRRNSP